MQCTLTFASLSYRMDVASEFVFSVARYGHLSVRAFIPIASGDSVFRANIYAHVCNCVLVKQSMSLSWRPATGESNGNRRNAAAAITPRLPGDAQVSPTHTHEHRHACKQSETTELISYRVGT